MSLGMVSKSDLVTWGSRIPTSDPQSEQGGKRQVEARTRPIAPLGRCEDDRHPNAENERCDEQGLLPTGRVRQKPIAGSSGVGSSAITRAASARGAHPAAAAPRRSRSPT